MEHKHPIKHDEPEHKAPAKAQITPPISELEKAWAAYQLGKADHWVAGNFIKDTAALLEAMVPILLGKK